MIRKFETLLIEKNKTFDFTIIGIFLSVGNSIFSVVFLLIRNTNSDISKIGRER